MKLNSHFLGKLRPRRVPLRLILVIPFVLETFAAVGLVGWLSFENGRKAVDEVASQLRSEITSPLLGGAGVGGRGVGGVSVSASGTKCGHLYK